MFNTARGTLADLSRGNLGVPLLLLVMLAMMMLPMPPFLLDVFFTFNIALSIVVLLVCVYALRPLDFAVFPTILLVATLLRLALNVASTRVVMLHGQDGHAAAGKVIQAFGEVVIGGNYVVGIVVFAILMIINFVVVTKGAGRISEVSARFTLDAMPGKQMAIDADLNAGLIDQNQAKSRRSEVAQEAEFYGSMDGASKFVRGDAIAGLLILFINLIGGMAVGIFQHGMTFGDAGKVYALLTIGDGLVAQLPSLLLSTAAAIMVTRASGSEDMGKQINRQMFASPKALAVAAGIMAIMGIVPGMPHFSFLSLAAVAGGVAYLMWKKQNVVKTQALQEVQRQQELAKMGIAQVDNDTAAARARILAQPWWLDWTAGLFPVILAVFLLRSFLFEPFKIPSGSMIPTLLVGDLILVNKFHYGLRLPVLNTKLTEGTPPQRGAAGASLWMTSPIFMKDCALLWRQRSLVRRQRLPTRR